MNREVLRPALLAVGGALTLIALLPLLAGSPVTLPLLIPGLILVGAVLVERWHYQPLGDTRPGPDWVATGERFVDPETGKLVTVFYKPATGERRYIGR